MCNVVSGIGQSADLVGVTVLRNFANALPKEVRRGEGGGVESDCVSLCSMFE